MLDFIQYCVFFEARDEPCNIRMKPSFRAKPGALQIFDSPKGPGTELYKTRTYFEGSRLAALALSSICVLDELGNRIHTGKTVVIGGHTPTVRGRVLDAPRSDGRPSSGIA
jgi:hypothetical protein